MVKIDRAVLEGFPLPLPPRKEQEAIAEALSDADALIESLEQLIAKKRLIKQGVMQELLTGKRRLPGFGGKSTATRQTDVGPAPEDWEVRAMGELGQTLIGLTYSPSDVHDHGTLVLRSSNIQNDRLAFADNVFVQMDVPDRATSRSNDILVCVRNGSRRLIGKCVLIDEDTAGSAFGAFMSVFRSDMNRYLVYQLRSQVIQAQINEILGATINQITSRDLNGFRVLLPPSREEQDSIVSVLSDMDRELDVWTEKVEKARQIKQGMMHNLLTGKIRLI